MFRFEKIKSAQLGICFIFGLLCGSLINYLPKFRNYNISNTEIITTNFGSHLRPKLCQGECKSCKTCNQENTNHAVLNLNTEKNVDNLEEFPKEILHFDLMDSMEGDLGSKFSMAVGLTPHEQKEIENIMYQYGEKLKVLQLERLVPIESSSGSKFVIPAFANEGQTLKGEFIANVRSLLDEPTYLRFMAYGVEEIYKKMGFFGESKIEFTFQNDNGESVLTVVKGDLETREGQSSRFIGKAIPSPYAHLFIFDE